MGLPLLLSLPSLQCQTDKGPLRVLVLSCQTDSHLRLMMVLLHCQTKRHLQLLLVLLPLYRQAERGLLLVLLLVWQPVLPLLQASATTSCLRAWTLHQQLLLRLAVRSLLL